MKYTCKRENKELKQTYLIYDPISAWWDCYRSELKHRKLRPLKFCEIVPPQGIYMHIYYNT